MLVHAATELDAGNLWNPFDSFFFGWSSHIGEVLFNVTGASRRLCLVTGQAKFLDAILPVPGFWPAPISSISELHLPVGERACSRVAACNNSSQRFRAEVLLQYCSVLFSELKPLLSTSCKKVVVVCLDDMTIVVRGQRRRYFPGCRTISEEPCASPAHSVL